MYVSYSERFPRHSYFTVQTSNMPCSHTSCKVHWCWRWNFLKCIMLHKLYQLCHLNNKYWYLKQYNIYFLSTILELYNEIALSWKPFWIGQMYRYAFSRRMTSQNTDFSSWDALHNVKVSTMFLTHLCQIFILAINSDTPSLSYWH
jgi:hypothetical protein